MSHNNKGRGENSFTREKIIYCSLNKCGFAGAELPVKSQDFPTPKLCSKHTGNIESILLIFRYKSWHIIRMIVIGPAEIFDIDEIVSLSCQLFEKHRDLDPEYYQSEADYSAKIRNWAGQQLNSPSQFLLVAKEDGKNKKVRGFISGYIKNLFPWFKIKSVGHISFLAVYPEFQKKGVGGMLNEAAEKWFSDKKQKYIEVYTNEDNSAGIAAWKTYGYLPFNKFLKKKISP